MVSVQNPECPKDNTVLYVLSAALFLSLTVIVFLIYSSTKPKNSLCGCCAGKKCGFYNSLKKLLEQIYFTEAFSFYPTANSPPQRNAVKVSVDPLKQQVKKSEF